jgi:hypothetical protein
MRPLGEAHLFTDLQHLIPARAPECRRDELGADVTFAESVLVHIGVTKESLVLLI